MSARGVLRQVCTRAVCAVAVVLVHGCATLTSGTTQRIVVTSSPSGATVMLDSVVIGVTPVSAEIPRKSPRILTVTHPRAAAETLAVYPTETESAFYWNLLWGPYALIFMPLDVVTGASRAFPQSQLHVDLARRDSVTGSDSIASTADAGAADAAPWLDLPWGSRVRVRTGGGQPPVVGRFMGLLGDTLVVETDRTRPAARRLRSDVRSVDVSAGANRIRGALRGAGFGAIAGFGVFALLGLADGGGFAVFLGMIGAAYGAPLGAAFGLLALPSDDWSRVYDWAP